MNLVWIFGMFNLVPKLEMELSQFKSSYLFLNWHSLGKREFGDKKQIWNFLNNLEVQEQGILPTWVLHLVARRAATVWAEQAQDPFHHLPI